MLTLTLAALEAILQLMHTEDANGLRLHVGSRRFSRVPAIQIEAARQPHADDFVLEIEGAHLYLDPETYKVVDDKVLDADLSGKQPVFLIYQQRGQVPLRPRNDEGTA
jgi:Fe-S cluster assembly iron-binding protein IscA